MMSSKGGKKANMRHEKMEGAKERMMEYGKKAVKKKVAAKKKKMK